MNKRYVAFGLGIGLSAAVAFGTPTVEGSVMTIDNEMFSVATEADFSEGVTSVVLKNGGGVEFTSSLTVSKVTFSFSGDGQSATGVVSVASGKNVSVSAARLGQKTFGNTLVKRGAGSLIFTDKVGTVNTPTRWIIEEGRIDHAGGDLFGGHSSTTTNLAIDVREGATYRMTTNNHNPMGPLELTGGTFHADNTGNNAGKTLTQWGQTSFQGGVTAHACESPSWIKLSDVSWTHMAHYMVTNVPFTVDANAVLVIDGLLTNGYKSAYVPNVLVKKGAGELVLLKQGGWTGGTILEEGTITIADSRALWTGDVTLAGDVTLNVLPGVTFVCPPLKGTGTLTKTGAGVATFPSKAAGVTVDVQEPGTVGTPLADGVLTLNGSVATIDVPSGQTLEVSSIVEARSGYGVVSDIVKTGDGTLVLPTGSASKYGRLIVKGGFVNVASESCFGASGVTVQNGGGLRFTASMNQARSRITCVGEAVLDVPQGVTLGIHSNYFVTTGATVTKTGLGTWQLKSVFRKDVLSWIDFTGTKWITHEGKLKFIGGDNFCGASGTYPLILEAHEGAVLELEGISHHLPLCAVVLRGATMWGFYGQYSSDQQALQGASYWKGFGLQGPITVLPSLNGEPSYIRARQCHLAHGGGVRNTIFDVQTGATLVVDTMLQPGRNGAANANTAGLIKRGGGTLKLLKPIGTKGTFDVEAGTVELGPKMRLNSNIRLNVAPGAKFVLGDGSQISSATDVAGALCGTADVWFDASRLAVADGAAVSSVPNLGTAGGTFGLEAGCTGYTPAAPTFVAAGIGGLGTLNFNGSHALMLHSHTNRGARAQVFIVSKWTSWANTGGQGLWGGPFSMSAKNPATINATGDDNQCKGAHSYQHGQAAGVHQVSCPAGDVSTSVLTTGLAVNEPYITHSGRDNGTDKVFLEIWRTAALAATTNTNASMVNCDVDAVCVGARTRKGLHQIIGAGHASNRAYIGQIGEVLVFSRELTAAETTTIYAYLKKKWFNVGEVSQAASKELASTLPVEVQSGEASLAANFGTTTAGTGVEVQKTGAGALRLGASFAGPAFVDVAEGGLVLKDGALPPQVDIWMDAANPDGIALDANGRVTNLVNRGACGGSFVRNTRKAQVPFGPIWNNDGRAEHSINGRPALVFDGDSALALFTYTNYTAPRSLNVYCVGVRTRWELNPAVENGGGYGKWAGPFSLGNLDATQSDEGVPGVVNVQEEPVSSGWVDIGSATIASLAVPATGDPYLMVIHSTSNGAFAAYEKVDTDVTKVPRNLSTAAAEPFHINIVQLGTRTSAGGGPQWWGHDNNVNRSWFGRMGEFIATTEPLSEEQEVELFAYLRKKWFNKGDGSTTPPAWLSGIPAAPTFGAQTVLSMADGTSLRHEAACVTLGAIATDGAVDWTRVWSGAGDAELKMFDLAGDAVFGGVVTLTVNALPKNPAPLVQGAGELPAVPITTIVAPKGKPSVTKRTIEGADAYWFISSAGTVVYLR